MPFVLRVVQPKYLSRTSLHDVDGNPKVKDEELLAVTNCTLSNALRQLASLVILANDIFDDLTKKLDEVGERSKTIQLKISKVGEKVEQYDPKKVTVPEGDLSAFAIRRNHFSSKPDLTADIFTANTRPQCVTDLYASAGRIVVSGSPGDTSRHSLPLLCTPVLGARQRKLREKIDVDIETRLPAAIEELRKWTSTEALGDVTVAPGALNRITTNVTLTPDDVSDGCGFSSGDDEPLDHKLPSPEEQFIAIASKFAPELVPIDTSGKGFDRMCTSRRSLLYVDTSCDRNQTGDSQTVRRRTRSRKPRGKRRNTITGTDQKEIRDAIAGDACSPVDEPESPDSGAVMRSHSSDLLKKSPFDVQNKKSHFNTLRQWGRSRLRLISRSPSDTGRDASKAEKNKSNKSPPAVQDIDDVNIYETVTMRRRKSNSNKVQDRKISHERNNSYSSSEKSMGIPVSVPMSSAMSLAVKLRDVNSSSRRRRLAGNTTVGPVREEPHSSSGNWSASSESGRTSIGSEITSTTAAPRSTTSAATSSNSLNVPHGPPSSIVSRRRFLNTSGSGSVTSEGTLTPDIIHDLHDDMETSSEFSCDTEGYYTSFHMDSGLKTLKEEEISLPITPLHTTNTFSNSSSNQTVLTAESEYELFGKGSTSTTTSSAGTVCTTLLAAGSDRSLVLGPTVPERKSSLSKLNKSRSSSGSSSINLERSCSNSTTGSNSEWMGTIKRNTIPKNNKLNYQSTVDTSPYQTQLKKDDSIQSAIKETVVAVVHEVSNQNIQNTGAESPDSGHNTSSSPIDDSVSSAHGGKLSCSELDYSESSDLEGVDRIERIRVKTTINSSRIPSMCVITPNNSDDESVKSSKQEHKNHSSFSINKNTQNVDNSQKGHISNRPKLELPPQETDLDTLVFNDEMKNYDNVYVKKDDTTKPLKTEAPCETKKSNEHNILSYMKNKKSAISRPYKSGLLPLNNLMCKLKEVFPQKLSMKKSPVQKEQHLDDTVYTDNGEYVTIADVRNNNQKININNTSGVYYTNDVVKRNLQTVLSGRLQETEYVSLNELPSNISTDPVVTLASNNIKNAENTESLKRVGAKVTLDSSGTVIYSSDSLKRRKGAHTTFEPGPFVKDLSETIDECDSADKTTVASVDNKHDQSCPQSAVNADFSTASVNANRPLSPQLGKVIIRAPSVNSSSPVPTSEVIRMPPSNIVTPSNIVRPMSPRAITKGAYVNIQDAEGISLSPTKDNNQDYRPMADQPHTKNPDHLGNFPTSSAPLRNVQNLNAATNPYNTYSPGHNIYGLSNNVKTSTESNKIFNNPASKYWTLQQSKISNKSSETNNTRPTLQETNNQTPFSTSVYKGNNSLNNVNANNLKSDFCNSTPKSLIRNSESFKMSPIDPRNSAGFQASTPTQIGSESCQTDMKSKNITSPIKSTMSNEELYAVIHKSKKKMNIKSPPLDRAISPALSSTSLSPGSSESSISGRVTPNKLPETGYLTDVRVRHSWSPNIQENIILPPERRIFESKQDNNTRQSWACSDRLGPVPQTSRLDFKKLLLQHGVKLNLHPTYKQPVKPSAVERLRLSKESNNAASHQNQNTANVNILDLSGSPKTYSHRRVIRCNNNVNPSSPSRTNALIKDSKTTPKILLSPKTQWRFSSPRSDVLSSPIPEAFNEDESPNGSNEKDHEQIANDFTNMAHINRANQKQGMNIKRNLIPAIRENIAINDTQSSPTENGIVPINGKQIIKNDNSLIKNNYDLFNKPDSPGRISRAEYLQAQKAQFLSQNLPPVTLPAVNSFSRNAFLSDNRSTHDATSKIVHAKEPVKCPSPPTLETAL